MRIGLINIILSLMLFFTWETSLASLPSGENDYNLSLHGTLSCLDCHSSIKEDSDHPPIEDSNESCMECHEISSGFSSGSRNTVDCLSCHSRHNESVSNDAHFGISCRECHLHGIKIVKKIKNEKPVWGYEPDSKSEYNPHRMENEKDNICSRCHYKGNNLGVSDNALPAKSIICMPCHAATFSAGGILSITAIIVFLIGIVSILFVWMAAGKSKRKRERLKFADFISLIDTLIFDALFQRRLLKISVKRWIIHGMIIYPFVIRFLWGIAALAFSLYEPEWNITWTMLNKNNPLTGFIFDITGFMILMGGCLMVIEKRREKRTRSIKDLPKSNIFINALLGGMIITGFIVEGARIAMTGSPEGSQFAFIGYIMSRALLNFHLNGVYSYLWYLHAVLSAAFIACLPFSRMFHVFVAPLSLLLKGVSRN